MYTPPSPLSERAALRRACSARVWPVCGWRQVDAPGPDIDPDYFTAWFSALRRVLGDFGTLMHSPAPVAHLLGHAGSAAAAATGGTGGTDGTGGSADACFMPPLRSVAEPPLARLVACLNKLQGVCAQVRRAEGDMLPARRATQSSMTLESSLLHTLAEVVATLKGRPMAPSTPEPAAACAMLRDMARWASAQAGVSAGIAHAIPTLPTWGIQSLSH